MNEKWSGNLMFLFCALSLIPLFGWIVGGLHLNKEKNTEERRQQAFVLIVISTISFVFSQLMGVSLLVLLFDW